MADDELLSLSAAAVLLGVHPNTVRNRVADGALPAYRLGPRLVRVRRDDVEALLRPIPAAVRHRA